MTDAVGRQICKLGRQLTLGLRGNGKLIAIILGFFKTFTGRFAAVMVTGQMKIKSLTEKFEREFSSQKTAENNALLIHYGTKFPHQSTRRHYGIVACFLIVATFLFMGNLSQVYASEIQPELLASAIRKAEGNPNYGILKKIKGRNYRKACIQTINHRLNDWKLLSAAAKRKFNDDFIAYLGSFYCPTSGSKLRPAEKKLNRYWVGNVTRLYSKLLAKKNLPVSTCRVSEQSGVRKRLIKSL
jgi:hypothetical protein